MDRDTSSELLMKNKIVPARNIGDVIVAVDQYAYLQIHGGISALML